jgi:hypothetical protein
MPPVGGRLPVALLVLVALRLLLSELLDLRPLSLLLPLLLPFPHAPVIRGPKSPVAVPLLLLPLLGLTLKALSHFAAPPLTRVGALTSDVPNATALRVERSSINNLDATTKGNTATIAHLEARPATAPGPARSRVVIVLEVAHQHFHPCFPTTLLAIGSEWRCEKAGCEIAC